MSTITVETRHGDYRARILPHDESWQDAADRAVRRAYGRNAHAWRWSDDGWRENAQGDVVCAYRRATIVGPDRGHGYPVLGEARVTLTPDIEG